MALVAGRVANAADGEPAQPDAAAAITRGLAALEKAAAKYPEHRGCFSCHHQTLPLVAQTTARTHGFQIAAEQLPAQLDFTVKSFAKRRDSLVAGEGIGGRAMTVAYGLWAIALADGKPDETTDAMVRYLLKTQRPEGKWIAQSTRPPLEESYQTCTVLAILGLQRYATAETRDEAAAAISKAKAWLISAPAKSQEDIVSRLWGLKLLEEPPDQLVAARQAVLCTQRSDGGWAQLDERESDAYATGQTLYVLQATGLDPADAAYQRGMQFLVKSQRDDGYWLVESRARPIQPYYDFDDEDPLAKNQFISVPATSWAVAALAAAVHPAN